MTERVKIFDTTLRDGEQTPDVAYTPAEKLQLARMLLVDRTRKVEGVLPEPPPSVRIAQFAGRYTIFASTAPTFIEKARLFPGTVFVVGYDTAARILHPRYYGNSHEALRQGLDGLVKAAEQGTRFSWHQDSGYSVYDGGAERHAPYLTCWLALDDMSEENGTISLLPYSRAGTNELVEHWWSDEASAMMNNTPAITRAIEDELAPMTMNQTARTSSFRMIGIAR